MSRRKQVLQNVFLLLITLFFCFFVAELLFRSLFPLHVNDRYGWIRNEAASDVVRVHDDAGWWRNVTVNYTDHGFKRWGDLNASNKVLIIGDSYTEMRFVNNDEEWYAYLERAYPDASFFVHGTGGFGTLQEYLVLDEFVDEINPDVVIWQFYFNDFANNDFIADSNEYPMNNYGLRPYLESGVIIKRYPAPLSWLRSRSRLAEVALQQYDAHVREKTAGQLFNFYQQRYGKDFWNHDFSNANIYEGRFPEVLDTTTTILQMGRARTNATIYLLSADNRLAWAEERMCASANITYIPAVYDLLLKEKRSGRNPFVIDDGHWNQHGNKVVGEFLVDYFNGTLA